jgi:hypothetical protein
MDVLDEFFQIIGRRAPSGAFHQPGKSELGSAILCNKQMELTLGVRN